MGKRFVLALLLILPAAAWSADANLIATHCKAQWPGDKGLQSFCIKENRNYHDWLKYIRKRVFSDPEPRARMDSCIAEHQPDYRQAFDCYWDGASGWFN